MSIARACAHTHTLTHTETGGKNGFLDVVMVKNHWRVSTLKSTFSHRQVEEGLPDALSSSMKHLSTRRTQPLPSMIPA